MFTFKKEETVKTTIEIEVAQGSYKSKNDSSVFKILENDVIVITQYTGILVNQIEIRPHKVFTVPSDYVEINEDELVADFVTFDEGSD